MTCEGDPAVAYNPTLNQHMAAWTYSPEKSDGAITSRINAQRLDTGGALVGGRLEVGASAGYAGNPALVYLTMAHGFIVVWQYLYSASSNNIYQVLLSDFGGTLQPTSAISALSSNETFPALASNGLNGVQFVWEAMRNYSSTGIDIYGIHQELPFEDKYLPVIFRW